MSTTDAPTTTGVAVPSGDGEPRWLDEAEMAAWLPLVRLVLSHAVAALEDRGWVTRCPAATDRRGQLTRLTPAGRAVLEQVAPGHVAEVRRLVFDRLTSDEVDQLTCIAGTLLGAASR